jgi:hypothetical protein
MEQISVRLVVLLLVEVGAALVGATAVVALLAQLMGRE